ncbi:MAG: hypothetical protein A3K10_07275 [Bacteroidetes bacterium RIFCSPLOWO2_12_FULL_31_6]|nr:MAG: hypothetical protein A3K10_07275 [Bacteroidetes bacterium RIFCSPLOWO2_12_FULL_31_6]
MGFFLTILYSCIFAFVIYKWKFFDDNEIGKSWFVAAFGLKLLFSVLLTLIYTYYYTDRSTSDIYKYFDDSKIMFDALKNHPTDYFKMLFGIDNDTIYFDETYYKKMIFWYRVYNSNLFSDSHIIIRFNAFIRLFSFGHIYVHNVFINFISLLGLMALFRFFKPLFIQNAKVLFYALFLIPSVLFWGSGLLKEGLILFGLGFLLLSIQQLFIKLKWYHLPLIAASVVVLLYSKPYVIAALSSPMLAHLIYKKLTPNKPILSFVYSFGSLTAFISAIVLFTGKYSPFDIIIDKQREFINHITIYKTNSSFEIPELSNWFSIIKYTPNAWLNTFIRPYLWESKSPFVLLSSLENLLFIGLFMVVLFFPNKKREHLFYIIFCLSFVFVLFTIIGLMIPIFGALVRYKVPALPFLAIALLLLIDFNKLTTKYPFLKKFL